MRHSLLLAFLVALHLLLCGAYGARLGKFAAMSSATSQPTDLVRVQKNEKTDAKRIDDDQNNIIVDNREILIEEVKCKDDEEHCSSKGKGKYRKLITISTTIPTSSAKPIQENLDNKGGYKRMDTKRNDDKAHKLSSPPSIHPMAYALDKHHEIAPPEYENAMDMTVMDYSPAKKKPPIHN